MASSSSFTASEDIMEHRHLSQYETNKHLFSQCTGFVLTAAAWHDDKQRQEEVALLPSQDVEGTLASIEFGKAAREEHFMLDPDCLFLNHGSYGATLKPAFNTQVEWMRKMERNCVGFFDMHLPSALRTVTTKLASFIHCDPVDLVLVPNATSGVGAVLRSLQWKDGDEIITTNFTYAAIKNVLQFAANQNGHTRSVKAVQVDFSFPLSEDASIEEPFADFLAAFEAAITSNTRLAIIDHIISATASILPVKKLVEICHKHKVLALIDGAHAIGQIPLDLNALGADFYVSNCHKWLCCPKGTAFLHVGHRTLQPALHPHIISHGYSRGFINEFGWTGTADYSAFMGITPCIEFFCRVGADKIMKRNHYLAMEGARFLAAKWTTRLLGPESMFGSMAVVALPEFEKKPLSGPDCDPLRYHLREKYNCEIPVLWIGGRAWVRLSAHMHNEMRDYEAFFEVMEAVRKEYVNC